VICIVRALLGSIGSLTGLIFNADDTAERKGAIEKPDQPNSFFNGKGKSEMNVYSEKILSVCTSVAEASIHRRSLQQSGRVPLRSLTSPMASPAARARAR